MSKIYFEHNGSTKGPCELRDLPSLVEKGLIKPDTILWKEGSEKKHAASNVRGLFKPVETEDFLDLGDANITKQISNVRGQASQLITDLRSVNFQDEVFPIDRKLVDILIHDTVFWVVVGLAGVPLLISTIQRNDFQLTAFALFFAVLWGVVFKSLIVKADISWKPLAASLLSTGLVGIPTLLFLYESILPKSYLNLHDSKSGFTSLMGYIFHVGVCEELIKILPVIVYLLWARKKANPLGAILIGVFSGLGFAAFENMSYGDRAIYNSALLAKQEGIVGAAAGTQMAMVNVLLRSLSLVFAHAVFSGIFAYFVTTGFASGKRFLAMALIGLVVSAFLHGAYDWLTGVQMTIATGIIILSFMLFYAYLTKITQLISQQATADH
ncbi:MAG: PrsW family glutamic-type intramembrane protease [Pirellulales bacterium]